MGDLSVRKNICAFVRRTGNDRRYGSQRKARGREKNRQSFAKRGEKGSHVRLVGRRLEQLGRDLNKLRHAPSAIHKKKREGWIKTFRWEKNNLEKSPVVKAFGISLRRTQRGERTWRGAYIKTYQLFPWRKRTDQRGRTSHSSVCSKEREEKARTWCDEVSDEKR